MTGDQTGLVADIGRQSVRFALTGGSGHVATREVRSYSTADHTTFTSALLTYLEETGQRDAALPSVLAVAGMARGDLINLTGSRWYISLSGVESVLRSKPRAMNECSATALALSVLDSSAFTPIGSHPIRPVQPGGNYLVINLGTGLGVAGLITTPGGRLAPIQSEAGHILMAPGTPDEEAFVRHVRRKSIASAESLLSAPGLVTAYAVLAQDGRTAASPEEVTRTAGRDPVATAAVRMLVGYFGAFIGDLIFAYGAWDGVYLTGPVARAILPYLAESRFRQRLEAKDAFRRQLSDVPIALVSGSGLELLGAAAALREL